MKPSFVDGVREPGRADTIELLNRACKIALVPQGIRGERQPCQRVCPFGTAVRRGSGAAAPVQLTAVAVG